MEYYLYRNGKAVNCTLHDTPADAKAHLDLHRDVNPWVTWYMEDEDGREIT